MNISIAQYRNKSDSLDAIKSDLALIKDNFNGVLIVNDYIDLINFADGLHLGQEDLEAISSDFKEAIFLLRKRVGTKLLGLSTHNLEEIKTANYLDIDYIGLGAFRETTTKDGVQVTGSKILEIAKESKHKVAIIGGVKLSDTFEDIPQIYYKVIGSDLMKNYLNSF